LHNDKIIGGFWFYKDDSEKAFLHRIFIDPAFHKKGIGLKTFAFLFQSFPEIKQWSLKTPHWNTRTLCFYKKLGFEITEKTDRFSFFAKVMNRNT
jgi:GNAT superfamily N-acetyltransferase